MDSSKEDLKKQLKTVKKKLAKSEENALVLDQNIKRAHQEWIAALDMLEDPIFIHDRNFKILRCNHAYQQKATLPYSQIIGHPYYEIFPKTHAPLDNCLPDIENLTDQEGEQVIEIDDLRFFSRAYIARDKNKNYLYSVHILEDITEQIKIKKALQTSEAQYRRLFEAAKDGILILDGETGLIVDANPFILALTSYTLNEIVGKNLWEIGLIADIAKSKISFEELQTNEYIRYEDLPLQKKDGELLDVEFISNIYTVNDRKVIQYNIRDISEQVKAKKLLQESEEQFRTITTTAQDAFL